MMLSVTIKFSSFTKKIPSKLKLERTLPRKSRKGVNSFQRHLLYWKLEKRKSKLTSRIILFVNVMGSSS